MSSTQRTLRRPFSETHIYDSTCRHNRPNSLIVTAISFHFLCSFFFWSTRTRTNTRIQTRDVTWESSVVKQATSLLEEGTNRSTGLLATKSYRCHVSQGRVGTCLRRGVWGCSSQNSKGNFIENIIKSLSNFSYSRSLYAIAVPSVVCLQRSCALLSRLKFSAIFFAVWYLGHLLTSMVNFTEIVPGEPLRRGV